jgi:long-chain acyl-CoA synthetase
VGVPIAMNAVLSREQAKDCLIGPGLPFELDEIEIRGAVTRAWKHAPRSLRDVFAATIAHGDADFLVLDDERLSYAEHHRRVCRLAHALRERYGVCKGDRVAIAMRNLPEWSIAFWAATSMGAIAVPLNAWLSTDELAFCLADSGPRLAVVDGKRADQIGPCLADLDLQSVIVARGHGEGMDSWDDVLAAVPDDAALPEAMIDPDDDATIFYTSGTTGTPKGAVGTHRNICSNIMSVTYRGAMKQLCRGETPVSLGGEKRHAVTLVPVPFFHVTGCHAIMAPGVLSGATLILMHRWNPERALELIEREKITNFVGVPGMISQIIESPRFEDHDTASLINIGYGGAPAMTTLRARIAERLPQAAAENGYGLTELSSLVAFTAAETYRRKPDSVGPPVPICDIKIVGDDGATLATGARGEVCVKGPNAVRGYWNQPAATALTFQDGWVRTGDIGRLDEDGCLYVLDRAKDMLIRGGENVYCVEVENALCSHPAVTEAAVIGKPHDILGQEVAAVVRISPAQPVSEKDLIAHCAERIAAFKVPVQIDVRREPLPCNANGKIEKRQLQNELFPDSTKTGAV